MAAARWLFAGARLALDAFHLSATRAVCSTAGQHCDLRVATDRRRLVEHLQLQQRGRVLAGQRIDRLRTALAPLNVRSPNASRVNRSRSSSARWLTSICPAPACTASCAVVRLVAQHAVGAPRAAAICPDAHRPWLGRLHLLDERKGCRLLRNSSAAGCGARYRRRARWAHRRRHRNSRPLSPVVNWMSEPACAPAPAAPSGCSGRGWRRRRVALEIEPRERKERRGRAQLGQALPRLPPGWPHGRQQP